MGIDKDYRLGHQAYPTCELRTAIGLDIGGTKIAGGVVTDDGTLLDLLEVSTPTISEGPRSPEGW
jgi:predicted NBD/HSP70 family sugar kinase